MYDLTAHVFVVSINFSFSMDFEKSEIISNIYIPFATIYALKFTFFFVYM